MPLSFITSNPRKFFEVQSFIPDIQQLDIDLVEIQEIDPQKIVTAKIHEAFHHHAGPFIVEDTSLYIDELHGLPGPLIKWFMQTIGNEGLYELASKLKNQQAMAKTIIGYATSTKDIYFFEGETPGLIVPPRGDKGFGWNPVFQPVGSDLTFGEMTHEVKMGFSMRRKAVEKLKVFLGM